MSLSDRQSVLGRDGKMWRAHNYGWQGVGGGGSPVSELPKEYGVVPINSVVYLHCVLW